VLGAWCLVLAVPFYTRAYALHSTVIHTSNEHLPSSSSEFVNFLTFHLLILPKSFRAPGAVPGSAKRRFPYCPYFPYFCDFSIRPTPAWPAPPWPARRVPQLIPSISTSTVLGCAQCSLSAFSHCPLPTCRRKRLFKAPRPFRVLTIETRPRQFRSISTFQSTSFLPLIVPSILPYLRPLTSYLTHTSPRLSPHPPLLPPSTFPRRPGNNAKRQLQFD
jgi:hypothetical protein